MSVDVSLSSSDTSVEYHPKQDVARTSQIPGTEALMHNTVGMEGEA